MFTIQSTRAINGVHWGLNFVEGVAHTDNIALSTKLLLKGYVVTDDNQKAAPVVEKEPDQHPIKAKKGGKDRVLVE